MPSSSCSRKSNSTLKKRGTSKKCQNSDVDLDWDETFEDAFVADVEVADQKWDSNCKPVCILKMTVHASRTDLGRMANLRTHRQARLELVELKLQVLA